MPSFSCPGRDAARAQRSGASLIRDRQRLRRSRVCSAPQRNQVYADCVDLSALLRCARDTRCPHASRRRAVARLLSMRAKDPLKSPRPSRRKRGIHAKREPRSAERRPVMRYRSTGSHCFRLIRTMRCERKGAPARKRERPRAGPSTTFARGCRRRGR